MEGGSKKIRFQFHLVFTLKSPYIRNCYETTKRKILHCQGSRRTSAHRWIQDVRRSNQAGRPRLPKKFPLATHGYRKHGPPWIWPGGNAVISPGKSWRLSLVLLLGIWFGLASPGNLFAFSTYYQPIYERDTVSLRVSLHRLIRDQKKLGYSSLWTYYKQTDRRPDGRVRDIYSNCNFDYFRSDQGGPPGTVCGYLSREHTWPKSTWGGTKNTAYSDLINVVPGDAHTNGQKGTNPPGEVGPSSRQVGSMKFGRARPGLGYSGEVFEPADRYKGDFARIYFYFVVRYLTGEDRLNCSNWPPVREDGTGLKPWAQEILLRWHRQDPVDSVERRRNDAVFRIQRNRNPFVDHPEWVEEIWDNESRADISPGLLGVDSNYWLRMQREGANWRLQDQPVHPFRQLAWQGVKHIRIRLWTGDTGPSGLRYATKTAEEAQKYGLKPYIVIFLSRGVGGLRETAVAGSVAGSVRGRTGSGSQKIYRAGG